MLPTVFKLYDNKHHLICNLEENGDSWSIENGILTCERLYSFQMRKCTFTYDLSKGAPIHGENNIKAVLQKTRGEGQRYIETVIVITKQGDKFVIHKKGSDEHVKTFTRAKCSINTYLKKGWEQIPKHYHKFYAEQFNNILIAQSK